LSCLAATCAIQQGHVEEAVDLGRSMFWQQASSLRTDMEELKKVEPELADQFEVVGQKLNAGNSSGLLLHNEEQNVEINSKEHIGKGRCHHAGEWEGLLERVRRLPQFEHFLKPVPFCQLRQAATGGQVVIVNASMYGAHALIFDASHQIQLVPLPNADIEQLSELVGDLLSHRPMHAHQENPKISYST